MERSIIGDQRQSAAGIDRAGNAPKRVLRLAIGHGDRSTGQRRGGIVGVDERRESIAFPTSERVAAGIENVSRDMLNDDALFGGVATDVPPSFERRNRIERDRRGIRKRKDVDADADAERIADRFQRDAGELRESIFPRDDDIVRPFDEQRFRH